MIHFTCDACQRVIQSEVESRYVVRMEVYEAPSEPILTGNAEADHLHEIEELIERMDDDEQQIGEDFYKQLRYDLCPDCRKQFLRNPLGPRQGTRLGFSSN